MIDLMGMTGGGAGGKFTLAIERDIAETMPGTPVTFTVAYENLTPGMSLYWTLGGDLTEVLVAGGIDSMSGEVLVEEESGTFTVVVETTLQETLDALKTMRLEIRILSREGNIIGVSEDTTVLYEPHPIGQQVFINPGLHEWVVPDQVMFLSMVAVGAGEGAPNEAYSRGGDGGSLRWSNRVPVTPGETLLIEVGKGGECSNIFTERRGGDSVVRRADDIILRAVGGASPNESTPTTYEYVPREWISRGNSGRWVGGYWRMPAKYPMIGGGDGGLGGPGGEDVGPGGGGGTAGYGFDGTNHKRSGGDGGNRLLFTYVVGGGDNKYTFKGGKRGIHGGAGGGAYYYTAGNNSHHATPGGGVGLLGQSNNGRAAENNDPSVGGGGGSGGLDGLWTEPGIYGAGARGKSSLTGAFPGAVYGGNGAVRLIWGTGREYPNKHTGNR